MRKPGQEPAAPTAPPAPPAGSSGWQPGPKTAQRALAERVRYDRFKVKIPEPGENKIPAYRVPAQLPIAVVLGILAAALWMFAPDGIQMLRPQPIPDSFTDASARWSLVLTMQRIDRFQSDRGTIPQSLEELDPYLSQIMTYQRLPDGGYMLQAPGPEAMIALTTNTPREPFLARSGELLRRGPKAAR